MSNVIDRKIHEYFKLLGEKVGIPPLSMQQIQDKIKESKPEAVPQEQAPPENLDLPSNINLSNYVDSDTESENSDDEVEPKILESSGDNVDV